MSSTNSAINTFLSFLKGEDLMLKLSWDEYLKIEPPFPKTQYSVQEVTSRYSRNGYEWDIHGKLYTPEKEVIPKNAIIMVHGGAVNESTFDKAPKNRPGWARVVASQGFKVLTVSYPGLWPPGGVWSKSAEERTPIFLLDRDISSRELKDRILKYTFNLVVQGIAALVDQNLSGSNILVFGHSIGARLVVDLWKFTKNAKVTGILGFSSLGPKRWEDELNETLFQRTDVETPREEKPTLEKLTRYQTILPQTQKPRIFLPILRTPAELEECVKISGLPREEYFDNTLTREPDRMWLKSIRVLLLFGENDTFPRERAYWPQDRLLYYRPAYYVSKKFFEATSGTRLVIVPKFTHTGHLEPHSEMMTYLWLWAIKAGYFQTGF